MGKFGKTLFIIGSACCLIGFVFFGIGLIGGGKEYIQNTNLNSLQANEVKNSKKHLFSIEKTKLSAFDSLDVDLADSDFRIEKSDDESCYLKYEQETMSSKNPFSYQIKDHTLSLKENGNTGASYHVDISFLQAIFSAKKSTDLGEYSSYKNYVTLYVPEDKTIDSVNMNLGNGDLFISSFLADTMDVQLDNGDIAVDSLNVKNATISSSYGDCDMKHASFGDVKLTDDDGDVTIRDLTIRGNGDINLSFGDGTFTLNKSIRNKTALDLSTGYGEIDTSSIHGDKILTGDDDENRFKRTLENPVGKLTIYSADGDITVK